ncbi:hypothetical protein BP6252_09944 [Coleophoma cylindrospora]|uniref:Uncharacterized protein n=1 Tax=Coleophoma cylindrospora TaxID=1849047 RepID=A0A3D8QX20_9HELO|nr:hypothetical protein BP6252_09944 [Coleophoma cylindrospora]
MAGPFSFAITLSITGCVSTSPGIPNIYLLKLQAQNGTNVLPADFQIRLGYFGMCIGETKALICSGSSSISIINSTSTNSTNSSNSTSTASTDLTPTTLLDTAQALQGRIILPFLVVAAGWFFFALPWLVLTQRGKVPARHAQLFKHTAVRSLWLSVAIALVSAIATAQTAGALQYLTKSPAFSSISIEAGVTLQVLQWFLVIFSALFAYAVMVVLDEDSGPADGAGGKAGGE